MSRRYLESCPCGSGYFAPQRLDGYGIFLTYACDSCWPEKRKRFRADIETRYACEESIGEDEESPA